MNSTDYDRGFREGLKFCGYTLAVFLAGGIVGVLLGIANS